MLSYNFTRIFKSRGIDKPFTYFKAQGFSNGFATRLNQDRVKILNNSELEKICILFHCTPNDLLEWKDDKGYNLDKKHPMCKLVRTADVTDLSKTLQSIPPEKIEEYTKMIKDKLRESEE